MRLRTGNESMRTAVDRITHEHRIDLALRFIQYEARTSTIARWTQLSHYRIRALYRSHAPEHARCFKRHRGISPHSLDAIMQSRRLRFQAALFGAICKSLGALPSTPLGEPEHSLPGLERGELVCDAFDWLQLESPRPDLTIEQGLLVLTELARGEQIQLSSCRSCEGVMLFDFLSNRSPECPLCLADRD